MKQPTSEQLVAERIVKDLENHTVTQRHCHGLYRHWRCRQPKTWDMGFDVTMWPGYLAFTGDMGDYIFSRTDDMISFMRTAVRDRSYSAEKCVSKGSQLREFSERLFDEHLREVVDEQKGRDARKVVSEKCRVIRAEYDAYSTQQDAMRAMYESGLWDGCNLPDCTEYSVHFLWCLNAMEWFIKQLDAGNVIVESECCPCI